MFEFVSTGIGAQGTVCGGGRYDGLVEEIGGPSMPSLGFGLGLERLMLVLAQPDSALAAVTPPTCDLYVASLGDKAKAQAFRLAELASRRSIWVAPSVSIRELISSDYCKRDTEKVSLLHH